MIGEFQTMFVEALKREALKRVRGAWRFNALTLHDFLTN
jgi:hypothetical protein